jgi:hypothetical protein
VLELSKRVISDAGDSPDEPIITAELVPAPSSVTALSLVMIPKQLAAVHFTLEMEQALKPSAEGKSLAKCRTPTPRHRRELGATYIDAGGGIGAGGIDTGGIDAGGATPTTRRASSLIDRLTVSAPCGKGARLLDAGRFSGHLISAERVRFDIDRLRCSVPSKSFTCTRTRSRNGSDDENINDENRLGGSDDKNINDESGHLPASWGATKLCTMLDQVNSSAKYDQSPGTNESVK